MASRFLGVVTGSARLGGDQFRDADKVIGDEVHQEPCTNAGNAAVLGLAQGAVLLAPTENAFDRPAALLRQAITCMACGAAIDRASSPLAGLGRALVLRHMRCDIDGTQGRDMIPRVIGLVGARREAMADGLALGFQHRVGSAAFPLPPAVVTMPATASPCRFSMVTWPM